MHKEIKWKNEKKVCRAALFIIVVISGGLKRTTKSQSQQREREKERTDSHTLFFLFLFFLQYFSTHQLHRLYNYLESIS